MAWDASTSTAPAPPAGYSRHCDAPGAALQALLLDTTQPKAAEGDQHELRRIKVASHVYDAWTARGTRIAQLADRFMDGSIDSLGALIGSRNDQSTVVHGAASPDTGYLNEKCIGAAPPAIDVRHISELSYEEFVCRYMAPNMPVVIRGITEDWAAQQDWALPDGSVNIEFLDRSFGSSSVMATDTSRQADGCGVRRDMTLSQFCDWWRRRPPRSDIGGGASNAGHADGIAGSCRSSDSMQPAMPAATAGTVATGRPSPLLYLKDWHFASEHPHYKANDWLNDYYDAKSADSQHASGASSSPAATPVQAASCIATSDYRFVYLGPKGSWTPLHADMLRSFSWSVNVAGSKRWLLLPPRHTHLLFDRFGRRMAPSFDLPPGAEEQYPQLAEARRHVVEVRQGVGEALFVPSGWHHTVENTADTLSINHNWLNGWNLHWGLALLRQEHAEAAAAIEDCREGCTPAAFEGLVQRNMAANAGLGFAGLAHLAAVIAGRELRRLAAFDTAAAGGAASEAMDVPAACSRAEAHCQHVSATGCVCGGEALAAAAARAAAALAADVSAQGAHGTPGQASAQLNRQLHYVFNLRRALFVLDAMQSHDHSILGDDAAVLQFAPLSRHIRAVLDRFDEAAAPG